jgi:hypothetical protein
VFSPAACIYHPVRTAQLAQSAEFAEAGDRLVRLKQRVPEAAGMLDVMDVLPNDMEEDMRRAASKAVPAWDVDYMIPIMASVHREWEAAGGVIADASALCLDADLGQAAYLMSETLVPEAGCLYVHFGPRGPASPWPDARIEGCYLNACLSSQGIGCTFVLASPVGLCLDTTPAAVLLSSHARFHDGVFLAHGTEIGQYRSALVQQSNRHLTAWAPYMDQAVTALTNALRGIAQAEPVHVRHGYPQEAPCALACLAMDGSGEAALEAVGDLAMVGFRPVFFYGEPERSAYPL